ncbi:MAG: trimethylamine methyltransferase family protein [Gammaproteobacteria bacterium]|nr:trimethylamine methyltransferase family protein [Gammaproteobacteria bacterium]
MSAAKPFATVLADDGVVVIEQNAERLLATIGIDCSGSEQVEQLWRQQGARVEAGCIKVPAGLARAIIARSAPASFRQLARDHAYSIDFGQGSGVCAPASFTPFLLTPDGQRRYTTSADLAVLTQLVQASSGLRHAGTLCEVTDVATPVRHLQHLAIQFRYTGKPLLGPKPSVERYKDALMLATIVFEREMVGRCCLLNIINPDSPLRFDKGVIEALCYSAATGQATQVASWLVLGMMAPTTIAGALAQGFAEVLFGLATTQLVNPGAPVMGGIVGVPFSMKSMRPDCGKPTTWLVSLAAGQLFRRLGVPYRLDGGFTSAKCVDAQAAAESSFSLQLALDAGADFVLHAAGWMDNGLAVSQDKWHLDHAGLLHIRKSRGNWADDALLPHSEISQLNIKIDMALNDFVRARSEELLALEHDKY